jgi:hypothetical protein
MSYDRPTDPPREPAPLEGRVQEIRERPDRVDVVVELRNPGGRALHYIADVRAIVFDPATSTFTVRLSEQGLEPVTAGMQLEPRFGVVDPGSVASTLVRLPKTIVRMADTAGPDGEMRFEEYRLADAATIAVEVGWSDTPYYPDPRDRSQKERDRTDDNPIVAWEQQRMRITATNTARGDRPLDQPSDKPSDRPPDDPDKPPDTTAAE